MRHILELWLESRAEITNVSYRMNSAIAPDRRSAAAAERVDSLPVLIANVMVRPAAGRIGEWTGLDPSACFRVSLFGHEIVGYKGHGLVRKRVLHLR